VQSAAGATNGATKTFNIQSGVIRKAHRIGIYGPGGVGKTTLASLVQSPKFLDLERGSDDLDVARVGGIETWADMRDALHSTSLWESNDTVIVDTATAAEELAVAHTIANVKHEKGENFKKISGIEDYGWGKGFTYTAEVFLHFFADLDAHYRAGRNVIVLCHREAKKVPNPTGEDFLQYQPRLQDSPRGNIRARFAEWCDHLIHLDFDTHVGADGKAIGGVSRTLYPTSQATFWAKSRTLAEPIPWGSADDATLWVKLFGKET
jgi:hypothetical protein